MIFQYEHDQEPEEIMHLLLADFTRRVVPWAGTGANCSLTAHGESGYRFEITKSSIACQGTISVAPGMVSATVQVHTHGLSPPEWLVRSIVDQIVAEYGLRPYSPQKSS